MSWRTIAALNLLTLRLFFFFNFNQEHVLKKSSDTPLPSCPGFLELLSPRRSVPGAGPKSAGAPQPHSRLPSADAQPAPPYSSGAQPAWTSCTTFLTCSPAGRGGRAPAPTFPGSSGLLSFPGGNDPHTWPRRTEKNLTAEIPDLRGGRLGNTFLPLPGSAGHVTLLCGQQAPCQSTSKLERLLCILKRDCFKELKVSLSLNLPEHGMIGTVNGSKDKAFPTVKDYLKLCFLFYRM